MDIETMAVEIVTELEGTVEDIKNIHGIKGAIALIPDVITIVEKRGKELSDMTGEQKKELAVTVINLLIDIPWVPESLEAKLIEFGIDSAVSALNKLVGKDWLKI